MSPCWWNSSLMRIVRILATFSFSIGQAILYCSAVQFNSMFYLFKLSNHLNKLNYCFIYKVISNENKHNTPIDNRNNIIVIYILEKEWEEVQTYLDLPLL